MPKLAIRKVFKGLFHPMKALEHIDQVLQISKFAKASERGERLVLKESWDVAKSRKDFVTLAHIQRYEWVISELKHRQVETLLDLGCGSGYGTARIAEFLEIPFVVGIDVSKNAITYALSTWIRPNLWFKEMSGTKLYFPSAFFDVVLSFDVLEHLAEDEQDALLQNIVKVLKPTGVCYLGCPNGRVSLRNNPHHKHELSSEEFLALCGRYFKNVKLLCQDIIISGERKRERWHYFISEVGYQNIGIFEDDCGNAFGLLSVCSQPKCLL
jgi:2-polyprenyl-3-methyl-5-hydroxy-6-metoxy-1,4-benzoquinol methylase